MNCGVTKQRVNRWSSASLWACTIILALASPVSRAQDAGSGSSATSLQAFKIITQRNIFNFNRHAGIGLSYGRRIDPSRLARANGFSLVGTLVYENGVFAFFDGTDSQFRKVLNVGGNIADYSVVEITPTGVKLESKGNQIILPVGVQMKRIDAGTWQMVTTVESPARLSDSTDAASTAEPGGSSKESAGTGEDTDPVVKRLMQQRERQVE